MKLRRWSGGRFGGAIVCLVAVAVSALGACGDSYGESPKVEDILPDAAADPPEASTLAEGAAPPPPPGETQWVRRVDLVSNGADDVVRTSRVAVGKNGSVALAGFFRGTIDIGGQRLTSAGPDGSYETRETFIAKFSASGEVQWVKRIEGAPPTESAYPTSMVVGPSGDLFVALDATGAAKVDDLTSTPSATGTSSFVLKLEASTGRAIWLTSFLGDDQGGGGRASVRALDVRGADVAVAGTYVGVVSVPAGQGTISAVNGTRGVFLGMLEDLRDGKAAALLALRGDPADYVVGVGINAETKIVAAVSFVSPALEVPGYGLQQRVQDTAPLDRADIAFVALYPDLARAAWATTVGSTESQAITPTAFALSADGAPILVGDFEDDYTFPSGATGSKIASVGGVDAFYSAFSTTGMARIAGALGGDARDMGTSAGGFANGDLVIGGVYASSNMVVGGKTLPPPGPMGAGFVLLRSATGAADWFLAYTSLSRAEYSSVASVAADSEHGRVIVGGDFVGAIDLGVGTTASSTKGTRESAFVASIAH